MTTGSAEEGANLYVATAQGPTVVTDAIACRLLSNETSCLVVARGTRLALFEVTAPWASSCMPGGLIDEDLVAAFQGGKCLVPLLESPVFGSILCLHTLHGTAKDGRDQVLVVLSNRRYFVVEFDTVAGTLVTRTVGQLRSCQPSSLATRPLCIADPNGRMLAMFVDSGYVQLLPLHDGKLGEPVNLTLPSAQLLDAVFLNESPAPTLAILFQATETSRRLSVLRVENLPSNSHTMNIIGSSMSLVSVYNLTTGLDHTSSRVWSVPGQSGVIIAASSTLMYADVSTLCTVEMSPCVVSAMSPISTNGMSGSNLLMSDHRGRLSLVGFQFSTTGVITSLLLDVLGEANIAEVLVPLGGHVFFLGSAYGDSQLIRLHEEPLPPLLSAEEAMGHEGEGYEEETRVEILDELANLGPIFDMQLTVGDGQSGGGQRQLITASGSYSSATLRVVRSGAGIQVAAAVELEGIREMWSLRGPDDDEAGNEAPHRMIVQAFTTETRVLGMSADEEMEELDAPGLDLSLTTLRCGEVGRQAFAQVTRERVNLVHRGTLGRIASWPSSPEQIAAVFSAVADSDASLSSIHITTAAVNDDYVVVSLTGGIVCSLRVDVNTGFTLEAVTRLDQEVAALSLHVAPPGEAFTSTSSSSIVAVITWSDHLVRLLALPSLTEVTRTNLGTTTQARDVLLVSFPETSSISSSSSKEAMQIEESNDVNTTPTVYLFIGLGDGSMLSYIVETPDHGSQSDRTILPVLNSRRKAILGAAPVRFTVLRSFRPYGVLALCDHPAVVTERFKKLHFTHIDPPSEVRGSSQHNSGVSSGGKITSLVPFSTSTASPTGVALSSDETLVIGAVEELSKLHIQTHPLPRGRREAAVCVQLVASASAYVVALTAVVCRASDNGVLSRLAVLDSQSFTELYSVPLSPLETVHSICQVRLHMDNSSSSGSGKTSTAASSTTGGGVETLIVVGTAINQPRELEARSGRISIFRLGANRELIPLHQESVTGAVFTLAAADDNSILTTSVLTPPVTPSHSKSESANYSSAIVFAGIRDQVIAYVLEPRYTGDLLSNLYLRPIDRFHGFVNVENLAVHGRFLAVADSVRSVTLLELICTSRTTTIGQNVSKYKIKFIERGVDYFPMYIRCVQFLGKRGKSLLQNDQDVKTNVDEAKSSTSSPLILGADDFGNLLAYRAPTKTGDTQLAVVGAFHLGAEANVIVNGSLASAAAAAAFANGLNDEEGIENSLSKEGGDIFSEGYHSVTGLNGLDSDNSVIFGTPTGAIGTVTRLSSASFQFFSAVEHGMHQLLLQAATLPMDKRSAISQAAISNQGTSATDDSWLLHLPAFAGLGIVPHESFRAFQTDIRVTRQRGVIDGDLVEAALALPPAGLSLLAFHVNETLALISSRLSANSNTNTSAEGEVHGSGTSLRENLTSLAARPHFTPAEIIRRVEDMARCH